MKELGLTLSAWKRASGVSDVTLRRMRDGAQDQFAPSKERPAERALGWGAGSFDLIRSGRPPTTISRAQTSYSTSAGLEERLGRMSAEQAAAARAAIEAMMDSFEERLGL